MEIVESQSVTEESAETAGNIIQQEETEGTERGERKS